MCCSHRVAAAVSADDVDYLRGLAVFVGARMLPLLGPGLSPVSVGVWSVCQLALLTRSTYELECVDVSLIKLPCPSVRVSVCRPLLLQQGTRSRSPSPLISLHSPLSRPPLSPCSSLSSRLRLPASPCPVCLVSRTGQKLGPFRTTPQQLVLLRTPIDTNVRPVAFESTHPLPSMCI
jgi:hypothetical protein